MKQDNKDVKKIKENIGLAEITYLWCFIVVNKFFHFVMEEGGIYSLVVLPLFELMRAVLRGGKNNETKEKSKEAGNAFQLLKLIASILAVLVSLTRNITIGFGIMIAVGYATILRNTIKTAEQIKKGNAEEVQKNIQKIILGGLISGGFTLMTFYFNLGNIGWCMAFAATSSIILSALPSKLAGLMKQKEVLIPAVMPSNIPTPPNSPNLSFSNNNSNYFPSRSNSITRNSNTLRASIH